MSTLPLLFNRLIDDAALFPPRSATVAEAVTGHAGHRAAWYAAAVGPLLCPASRLDELSEQATGPLEVSTVVDTGTAGIEPAVRAVLGDPWLDLAGVEVPLRGDPPVESARRAAVALDAALLDVDDPDELGVYLEGPRGTGWRAALEAVADSGYRAKLRTGGTTPEAFPPEEEVAAFILACLELDVPFKFTAGLHRAVRNTTEDGLEQHGFVNALLAVVDALGGADEAIVAATLASRDAAELGDRARALPQDRAAAVRTWLGSYGSCSIDEPIDDLVAMGLVAKP